MWFFSETSTKSDRNSTTEKSEFFDQQVTNTGLAYVHEHLSKVEATLGKRSEEMHEQLIKIIGFMEDFARRLTVLEATTHRLDTAQKNTEDKYQKLHDSTVRLAKDVEQPRGGLFARKRV